MSDLTRPPIRDLIAQLARIEDLRRVTPAHVIDGTSGAPSHAALSVAEQDIINELRRPGRPLRLLP